VFGCRGISEKDANHRLTRIDERSWLQRVDAAETIVIAFCAEVCSVRVWSVRGWQSSLKKLPELTRGEPERNRSGLQRAVSSQKMTGKRGDFWLVGVLFGGGTTIMKCGDNQNRLRFGLWKPQPTCSNI
jgi:hypothetical protein